MSSWARGPVFIAAPNFARFRRFNPRFCANLALSLANPCCPRRAPEMRMPIRGKPQRIGTAVELRGLEPLTPCMPCRCATSCATAPHPNQKHPAREDSPNYTGGSTPLFSGHRPRPAREECRRCIPVDATSAHNRWCSPPIQTTHNW